MAGYHHVYSEEGIYLRIGKKKYLVSYPTAFDMFIQNF